jgi:YVTN family beta-propeller protein
MHHRFLSPAAPALVTLILSFLLVGFTPALADAHALALSPDGHHLYVAAPEQQHTGEAGGIDVINTDNDTLLTTLPIQRVQRYSPLALSPDGRYLYAAGDLLVPPLLVIDLATGQQVDAMWVGLPEGSRETLVTDLAVSPDGRRLYVLAERPFSLSVVDTVSDKIVTALPIYGVGEALTPDGQKLYIASGYPGSDKSGAVTVLDTSTNRVTGTISVQPGPAGVVASPNDARVYVTHYKPAGGAVDLIDTTSDQVVNAQYPIPGGLSPAAAISPDGNRLYVLPIPWNVFAGIDIGARRVIGSVGVGVIPYDLVVSPDGVFVYVLNQHQPGSPAGSGVISVVDTSGPDLQVVATIDLAKVPAARR